MVHTWTDEEYKKCRRYEALVRGDGKVLGDVVDQGSTCTPWDHNAGQSYTGLVYGITDDGYKYKGASKFSISIMLVDGYITGPTDEGYVFVKPT